jgi:hypothetical protein
VVDRGQLALRLASPRLALPCRGLWRAPETDFRHAGLASTGPYDMNAAFMRLGRRERGIHVV